MRPLVSIITVNYNGYADTCEMIESFRTHETYPYEIIVVDNGSETGEADEIGKRYPEVRVVRNANNGFAGGNNKGLETARGEYLFFLNNDTLIKAPVLEALVARLQSHPQNGGVSPLLKYAFRPELVQYAGFTPLSPITLRNTAIGYRQADTPAFHTARRTAYLHGAAMMTSRRILQQAGPMTEVYFLFYEELDWSERIVQAGYTLWYEPAATVYHKEGMTAGKTSPLREFYLSRARILFARRNRHGLRKLCACLYLCLAATPRRALARLAAGHFALAQAVVKGMWNGLVCNPGEAADTHSTP